MERNFIRVRSLKDMSICLALFITGFTLVTLPTSASVNILGFFLIFTGLILAIFMKTGWKDTSSGLKFSKQEIYLDKSMMPALTKAIKARICATDIKDKNNGNGIRLDIYHNKVIGKGYVQLFEYVPYKYEPCTPMYEYTYENIQELLK